MRKNILLKAFGTGFIAAVSGIEITNIAVFSHLGINYGVFSFLLIVLAIIPLTYLQQIVLLPSRILRINLHMGLRNYSFLLYRVYVYSIYLASMLTLIVNIIGISIIYQGITNIKWIYYMILFTAVIWSIVNNRVNTRKFMKILTITASLLCVYIVITINNLARMNYSLALEIPSKISFIEILALWGAIAAPYSLYLQVIEEESASENYTDIYLGAFFNTVIGVSIASTAYTTIKTSDLGETTLILNPFMKIDGFLSILYIIGVTSSVLLASLTIEYVATRIINRHYEYSGRGSTLLNHLLAAAIVVTLFYSIATKIYHISYINIVLVLSALIGVLFTTSIITLTIYFLSISKRKKVFMVNGFFLTLISILLIFVSIIAVKELIIGDVSLF